MTRISIDETSHIFTYPKSSQIWQRLRWVTKCKERDLFWKTVESLPNLENLWVPESESNQFLQHCQLLRHIRSLHLTCQQFREEDYFHIWENLRFLQELKLIKVDASKSMSSFPNLVKKCKYLMDLSTEFQQPVNIQKEWLIELVKLPFLTYFRIRPQFDEVKEMFRGRLKDLI